MSTILLYLSTRSSYVFRDRANDFATSTTSTELVLQSKRKKPEYTSLPCLLMLTPHTPHCCYARRHAYSCSRVACACVGSAGKEHDVPTPTSSSARRWTAAARRTHPPFPWIERPQLAHSTTTAKLSQAKTSQVKPSSQAQPSQAKPSQATATMPRHATPSRAERVQSSQVERQVKRESARVKSNKDTHDPVFV